MNKLTKELSETLPVFVQGLHVIVKDHEQYTQMALSKKGYKGSYIIIQKNGMWFNNVDYSINSDNILKLEDHVKAFYNPLWYNLKKDFVK